MAEQLPFPDGAFDAALAVLTIHHWQDPEAGLQEMARVASRQVILTWDPHVFAGFWLITEYLPEIAEQDTELPTLPAITNAMSVDRVTEVPVPAGCLDGFLGAYWRRPEAYLDPATRRANSACSLCPAATVEAAMARLGADLASGRWRRRHTDLLDRDELDLGYRLVVATGLARDR